MTQFAKNSQEQKTHARHRPGATGIVQDLDSPPAAAPVGVFALLPGAVTAFIIGVVVVVIDPVHADEVDPVVNAPGDLIHGKLVPCVIIGGLVAGDGPPTSAFLL